MEDTAHGTDLVATLRALETGLRRFGFVEGCSKEKLSLLRRVSELLGACRWSDERLGELLAEECGLLHALREHLLDAGDASVRAAALVALRRALLSEGALRQAERLRLPHLIVARAEASLPSKSPMIGVPVSHKSKAATTIWERVSALRFIAEWFALAADGRSSEPVPPVFVISLITLAEQALFKKFDLDGNGRISFEEMHRVFLALNPGWTEAEINRAMYDVDENHDGFISWSEFVHWTEGGKFRKGKLGALEGAAQKLDDGLPKTPFAIGLSVTTTGVIKKWDFNDHSEVRNIGNRSPSKYYLISKVCEDDAELDALRALDEAPHEEDVTCVCVHLPSNRFVTGSMDRTLKLWDSDGKVKRTFRGGPSSIVSVDVDWTTGRMLSGDISSNIYEWNIESLDPVSVLPLLGEMVDIASICTNWNENLTLSAAGCALHLWDLTTGTRVERTPADQKGSKKRVSFSVANSEAPKPLQTFQGHTEEIKALQTDWSSQTAISSSRDLSLRLWDLKNGTVLKSVICEATIRSMSLDKDTGLLVTGDDAGELKVWQRDSLELKNKVPAHEGGSLLSLSTVCSGHVVTGGCDGRMRIWRLEDMKCQRELKVAENTHGTWLIGVAADPA